MDVSNDDYDRRDDDEARFGLFMYDKSKELPKYTPIGPTVTYSSMKDYTMLLNDQPENELIDLMRGQVYTKTQTIFMVANPEGNPEVTSFFSGASEVPLGTNVDVQATKFVLQELFEDVVDHQVSSPPETTTHNLLHNILFKSISHDQEYLNAQDKEPALKKRPHNDQDPPNDRKGEKRSKRRKDSKEVYLYYVDALNGIHRWDDMRKDFFNAEIGNRLTHKVYSDKRIITYVSVDVKNKQGCSFLTSIKVKRTKNKEHEFSYAYLSRLSLNEIEEIYLLKVQGKLHYLKLEFKIDFINALLIYIKRVCDEVHKFCDGTLLKVQGNFLKMLKENRLGRGNVKLDGREWTNNDIKRSEVMLEKIEKTLKHREQLKRLEGYVGGRPKTIDTRLYNYNMHSMGKTMVEVHAMLKLAEKVTPKKVATLAVFKIRGGKI
ncbi:hypothetical protein Tco_1090057 [Tanacetum coccineum]|uniref:Uncharacterized protein n=1 Tax=Tanacetum coccineum TaxID=301880 RepID=A0ABQ5I350_9ASTR